PNAYESALRAFDIAVHPNDPMRVAIGSDDTLLGSVDGGGVWEDLTTVNATAPGFFTGTGYTGLVSKDIVFNPNDMLQEHTRRAKEIMTNGILVEKPDWEFGFLDINPDGVAAEVKGHLDRAASALQDQ
ncbi:MAG: hypothetical protein AAGF19_12150, partial [Pseudomonadota bacterium]